MTKFLNNADIKGYIAQTAVTSYLLKADSTGRLVAAIAGTDYQAPTTALLPSGGTAGQILAKIDGTNYNAQWIDNYTPQVKHDVKLGAALSKGTPVYVSSANGTNMIVSAASNASEATSSKTLGLLETGGALNDTVKVITEGLLAGLNTSTATAGDPVWLGPNGTLLFGLANKPSAPVHMVSIGIVTRVQSVNGEIFVKVQNGFELDELHNVALASSANNEGLFYDSATSLWKNKTIAAVLGYMPANGANYLALTGGTLTGDLTLSGTNPRLYFTDTDNNPDYFISNTDGTFTVYDVTNSVGRFKIYSGGNAEFTGSVTTNSTFNITNGLTLFGNHISTQWYNGVDGVFVNYVGYNGGTTQFRNFYVYDGKQGVIATFDGSTKSATFSSSLSATNITLGSGTIGSIPSWMKVMTTDATQSGIGTIFNNKALYLYNNGSAIKLDAYDYSTSTALDIQIGGNGGKIILSNGQVRFTTYTSATSYSGTAAGYLAFDSSGNVITVAGVAATDNTKLPLAGGTTTGIVTFGGSNNSTDNVRFQNTDGNYAYIRQTAASNSNNVWYDATLGATMWYAWDNPGSARTANVYTQHIFGTGRGTSNEAVTINRGAISGTNSSGTTTYSISRDGSASLAGGITFTAPGGSILLKHAVSEVDAWIFQENATNWGLYWKNAPTGQHTFGGYTSVGAELVGMSAANASGNGILTSNFVGATTAYAQWMISNYTGYIWSASTIYAATSMVVGGNTVWHAGNLTNLNQLTNGPGYITSSATITGAAARISSRDNRTIAPNSDTASELRFGFTSWNNNSGAPYADYLHMRSYSDSSGGADNLITFLKSGIGMRIWQQTWGSATAYSSYVDVLHSGNYSSYALPLSGGQMSGSFAVGNQQGNDNPGGWNKYILIDGTSHGRFRIKASNYTYGNIEVSLWADSSVSPSHGITGSNAVFSFGGSITSLAVGGQTVIHTGNIGSQSVSYATNAGTASNISAYTINQSVGTGNTPTFNGVYLSSTYSHSYPGILQLGNTSYNYLFTNGTWASSITAGILANCSDNWEIAIHDSGHRVVSPIAFYGGASNYILMGRDIGWGTTYVQAASSFRAPIFYDSNNTAYYLDPDSTSYLLYLQMPHRGNGTPNIRVNDGGEENWRTIQVGNGGNYGIGISNTSRSWSGRESLAFHVGADRSFRVHSDGWDSLFEVWGSSGYARLKGSLEVGSDVYLGAKGNWMTTLLDAKQNTLTYPMYYAGFTLDADTMPTNSTGFTYSVNAPTTGSIVKFSTGGGYDLQLNSDYYWGSNLYFRQRNGDVGAWRSWRRLLNVDSDPYAANMNQYVRSSDSPTFSAIYASNWFRAYGDCGLYSQDYGGHIRRCTTSYGTWENFGYTKNGWGGFNQINNYYLNLMSNTSGDHGFFQENGKGWTLFYNRGNDCWGIGTDNTYSGDGFRVIKYGSAQYGWTTWSDRRAKENISNITGALDTVLAMRGVYFNYIQDEAKNKRVGFIAQELEQVLPEAVRYAEEIDEYSVEYAQIVSVLAEAIKEQNIKIQGLESQLQTLLN